MEVYRLTISQFAIDHGGGMKVESSTMPRIKCYLSSHNRGSGKWVPPRLVSFKLGPMRIFHFHEDGTMGNSTPLFQIYSRISFYSNIWVFHSIWGALFVCAICSPLPTINRLWYTEPSLNHWDMVGKWSNDQNMVICGAFHERPSCGGPHWNYIQ